MNNKDFQNGVALGLAMGGVVEVEIPAKEEQEKTITIIENGTTEILPDENKALSKVTVVTDVTGGGTELAIEYIESTGTQYIDTGIIPTNHRLKIKFQKNDSLGSSIFGSYGTTALTDSYELTWYQGKWYYSNGQKNTNHPTTPPAVTDVITLDYFTFDNKVIMNGNEVGSTLSASVSINPLYLFGKNATYQQLSSMKLWYAQIYDRETQQLVRDFVPAIDENGVICLYDNVTKAYFYNQGEGEFIGGFVENELIEIETLIDESGVLEDTEGTATEKVEQLIEMARSGGGNAGLPIEIAIPQFATPELDITNIEAKCELYNPPMTLKSTGTQYIDTGYVPNNNTKIVAELMFTKLSPSSTQFYSPYGCANADNNGIKCVQTDDDGLPTRFGSIASSGISSNTNITVAENTKYSVEHSINGFYFNGTLEHVYTGTTFSNDFSQTLYIFAVNNNGSADQRSFIKLYSFKIYENEELVRDFVPVTDESGVACLYDNITKAYFYNKGTGTFTFEVA